ncbi:hypothetical protein AYL99_03956 [Fonsecaea erecta]|uniref:Glutathione S-transferase n=1 Tax=Fonsecaea erecta TaxID=1367422 RepID=A0A178ZRD8_9EURO|nr:hypothetical protein AYL99_03956 [Fonsecaea erecta]OAP61753.1 hypothetical protein AYL99_03956 [Fonsecaea erecta]
MTTNKPMICFYTAHSPNGHKVAITLEELGLPYEVKHLDMSTFQHKEPWFLDINPNGRIPALTDTLPDGTSISLFESGSIMQYLVDRYDDVDHKISYPRGTKEFYQTQNWLFFQNAGVGPIQGQVNHFVRYSHATEPQTYATDRYMNETRRLYRTVDKHLKDTQSAYLVGDKCTIADIALTAWANMLAFAGMDIADFPNVKSWQQRMASRPTVQKGFNIPVKVDVDKLLNDPEAFNAIVAKNKAWIRQGMIDDRKQ